MSEAVVIIGAGPAGIGAGLGLADQGLVLEGSPHPGGLCRTIELDGVFFDFGGHSFHTPHPEVRDLVFRSLDMVEQPRNAWCYVGGDWVPYPFQKHFEGLRDPALREECRRAPAKTSGPPPANFDDYLERRFGPGVCRRFLRPYNQKLWGEDLTRLAVEWAGERVAGPAGSREQFVSDGGRRTPLQDDTHVAYPAHGGFGAILDALARQVPRLRLGQEVAQIDPRRRQLVTGRGHVVSWRHIVSTLPLPHLLRLLPDVPPAIRESAARLEALPLALVLVVLGRPAETDMQRIYCAGPEIPAHKIVVNHNSSPSLRALPQHGIQAEVARPGSRSDTELIGQVLDGLRTLGLLRAGEAARTTRVIRLAAAYPVPSLGRAAAVRQIQHWLAAQGIDTVGRGGEWAYINSDEALHRGLMLGRRLAQAA